MHMVQMTAAELAEYKEMKAARDKQAAAAKRKADIEAYKELVDECVNGIVPELCGVSEALASEKAAVYERFAEVLKLKAELFGTKDGGQWSHTFTNSAGTLRVRVGCHTLDAYDDTADAGVAMVVEYIGSLAGDDAKAKALVDMVLKLLQKDAKSGQLKASRVLQLERLAAESGDEKFIEGVNIIKAAYRPVESKRYVVAETRNELGKWVNIPLGMTEV